MTLYTVSSFEEASKQIGDLWRTLDRVHDSLGQSTGATQVLTQQMSEMGRIQGEQGKTLQTVLEQYKGVVQAQAATTIAVEENSENTARLADAVGKFGAKRLCCMDRRRSGCGRMMPGALPISVLG